MNKFLLSIIITTFFYQINAYSQTCRIGSRSIVPFNNNFSEDSKVYTSITFNINGKTLKSTDSLFITVPVNTIGFDTIRYTFIDHGQKKADLFICKLHPDEIYTISPCFCCGIFLMTPANNAERGYVKFKNHSNKKYVAMVSEIDYDTIAEKSETDFIFSSISMNCGFRPSDILIAGMEYMNTKYEFENLETKSNEVQTALLKEQDEHIIFNVSFLFLHAEKLVVTIDKNAKQINLKLQ